MVDIGFTIVFQWVNFAILLFLLTKLLFRPLTDFLDKRSGEISGNLADARRTRKEADEILESYQDKIRRLGREAEEIKLQARNEGLKEREKILARAKEESDKIVARGEEELRATGRKVSEELKAEAVDISLQAARKFLRREIDEDEGREFIAQSLKELEKSNA